jgi:hypothetical protein
MDGDYQVIIWTQVIYISKKGLGNGASSSFLEFNVSATSKDEPYLGIIIIIY